jgi:(S)-mandelate dehydrogenase
MDPETLAFEGLPYAKRYPSSPFLKQEARKRLPRFAFDFLAGGLGRGRAIACNEKAFDSVLLTPRYLVDLTTVDTSVELFGHRWAMPIGVSPVGFGSLYWPRAERALALAAQNFGVPFSQSTFSNETIEDIGKLAGSSHWFQVYACKDRGVTLDLVARASSSGATALLVTIDTPSLSKRELDWRNGLTLSMRPTLRQILAASRCPRWAVERALAGVPRLKTLEAYVPPQLRGTGEGLDALYELTDTWCDWATFDDIRRAWNGPLILKGVLDVDMARQAVDRGADALLVSNHGGRQFDAAEPTIHAISRIFDALGSRCPILLDSGVRSGLDVLRSLSRGASFCLSGRLFYYAMAALREPGAEHVMAMVGDELRRELRQYGRTSSTHVMQEAITKHGAQT